MLYYFHYCVILNISIITYISLIPGNKTFNLKKYFIFLKSVCYFYFWSTKHTVYPYPFYLLLIEPLQYPYL